jgi:hypothetical protein
MPYFRYFKSIVGLFVFEILTRNSTRMKSIKTLQDRRRIIFYVAPSDFNSVVNDETVPDKAHELFCVLQRAGYHPVYLVRYSINSSERLPLRAIRANKSILQVKIDLLRLLTMYVKKKKTHLSKNNSQSSTDISDSTLKHFMKYSLKKALKEINGSLIISIGASQELLSAAHSLDIKVVEIMHGIIERSQALNDWGSEKHEKPDLVMTWDDHYTRILLSAKINSVTLGYPQKITPRSNERSSSEIRILVTLGHSDHDSKDPYGALNEKLVNQILQIMSGNVKIIFRIHPVISSDAKQNKRLIKWLNKEFSNPEIHHPQKISLFESLEYVDVHLSKYSSSFFEAALYGIPTVFTDDVTGLNLPRVILESNLVIQGGGLDIKDITRIAGLKFVSPFEYMEEDHFEELIRKVLWS